MDDIRQYLDIMLQCTFRNFCRFSISQPVPHDQKNPYLNLPTQALKKLLQNQLNTKSLTISNTNNLILIGSALHHNKNSKNDPIYNKIVDQCIRNLEEVHKNIDNQEEKVLAQLEFGQLLELSEKCQSQEVSSYTIINNISEKLTLLYANTYSHILPFSTQLQIYEKSHGEKYDLIKNIAMQRINQLIKSKNIPLSLYISYLRQFYKGFRAEEIEVSLGRYGKYPSLCRDVGESQKLMLYYILIDAGCNTGIMKELGLEPSLKIQANDNEKDVCLKLQILKHQKTPIPSLTHLSLQRWSYPSLIWVSQFAHQPPFLCHLHQCLLSACLPPTSQPSTVFTYANNVKLGAQGHRDLNAWLCRQEGMGVRYEDSLCAMLREIWDRKWGDYYGEFYAMVLRMSLGNFKWESQNVIYYFGHVQGVHDENLEYLRRYILNTYASLGTARREIPTSSYFYKILQVANVQKFYGNL